MHIEHWQFNEWPGNHKEDIMNEFNSLTPEQLIQFMQMTYDLANAILARDELTDLHGPADSIIELIYG